MIAITEDIPQASVSLELNEKRHGRHVLRLLEFWAHMNERFFDGVFPSEDMPIVLFRPLLKEASEGIYTQAHHSEHGYPTILLCEQILTGSHPLFKAGTDEYDQGRLRYLEDVFVHEMIHHFAWDFCLVVPGMLWPELVEKDGQRMVEVGQAGAFRGSLTATHHGHAFCHKANQIAEILGIPKVRVATTEEVVEAEENELPVESFDDVPLCDYFLHNVRPREYYLNSNMIG